MSPLMWMRLYNNNNKINRHFQIFGVESTRCCTTANLALLKNTFK